MRIAQIARFYESVPPPNYGSTERLVSYLVEELVGQGHDVTLFASGDSRTAARLVPVVPIALRRASGIDDFRAAHSEAYARIAPLLEGFDIVHVHNDDATHFPPLAGVEGRIVTTFHYVLHSPHVVPLLREYADRPMISISDSQRGDAPWLNWAATVHHGLPAGLYRAVERRGAYLAFLGRVARDKRLDRAIRLAKLTGVELKIAAKIDAVGPEHSYYAEVCGPLMDDPAIDYVGEIGDREKQAFLGGALALLFPIDWQEPFGLVMIEAMACGTPVIAWRRGSAAEIIEHGVTGFLVDNMDQAVRAVAAAASLDRARVRAEFDRRFTAATMARNYLAVFRRQMAVGQGRRASA